MRMCSSCDRVLQVASPRLINVTVRLTKGTKGCLSLLTKNCWQHDDFEAIRKHVHVEHQAKLTFGSSNRHLHVKRIEVPGRMLWSKKAVPKWNHSSGCAHSLKRTHSLLPTAAKTCSLLGAFILFFLGRPTCRRLTKGDALGMSWWRKVCKCFYFEAESWRLQRKNYEQGISNDIVYSQREQPCSQAREWDNLSANLDLQECLYDSVFIFVNFVNPWFFWK